MPVFMPHERWRSWLDPGNTDIKNLTSLMQVQSPASLVLARPVSSAVNSVANNSQKLTVEIELGEPETLF